MTKAHKKLLKHKRRNLHRHSILLLWPCMRQYIESSMDYQDKHGSRLVLLNTCEVNDYM